MDIISGLGAASQAIGIVKAIREVDKAMDAATLKVRINELLDALVDTKNALLDAKEALDVFGDAGVGHELHDGAAPLEANAAFAVLLRQQVQGGTNLR